MPPVFRDRFKFFGVFFDHVSEPSVPEHMRRDMTPEDISRMADDPHFDILSLQPFTVPLKQKFLSLKIGCDPLDKLGIQAK